MWTDQRGSEILLEPECLRLLAVAAKQGEIGRLAYCPPGGRTPVVQPVNFVYRQRRILVALGAGGLADAVSRGPMSFEVDGFDTDRVQFWSVLARGLAVALGAREAGVSKEFWPNPLVPVPGGRICAIRIDTVSGRRFLVRSTIARLGAGRSQGGLDPVGDVALQPDIGGS